MSTTRAPTRAEPQLDTHDGIRVHHLHQVLKEKTREWREAGYPHDRYPAIAEILEYQRDEETGALRFLRPPQLLALETYWYLRLVEDTPRIFDLYRRLFTSRKELLRALGIPEVAFEAVDYDLDALFDRIRNDVAFVREHKLDTVHETLTLDYPSYILALAMGAGKTILIGAIIATEFAMAIEYPDGPFIQNALVFAPGKTIIESLRELAETPYNKILPPRLYRDFAGSLKLTFTRDGEKDIPVVPGSVYNVVVTNTEKIRIRKESIRKSDLPALFAPAQEDEAREVVANQRLRTIASLPHLGIFSDEAHHTYGRAMGADLKRVRQTVDYLHRESPNLVCVVNTTGTPYFERQPLRDVVVWYGLSEGIRDDILKDVGHVYGYDFAPEDAGRFVEEVVTDFFRDYGDVSLPDGTPAKLAIYFPSTDDVRELRPVVESTLVRLGLSPTLILEHHTAHEETEEFNRFRTSAKRVALLVNRGTEGWNVPALFACALARKLRSSNNFVLQAATRCLRQVPGNAHKARIYLSMENRAILEAQLRETYGESIADLERARHETGRATLQLRKFQMPPVVVRQVVRTVVPADDAPATPLRLERPIDSGRPRLRRAEFRIGESPARTPALQQIGDTVLETEPDSLDLYTAAVTLAQRYRLDVWEVRDELARLYADEGEIPLDHIDALARQIEQQRRRYVVREETIDVALALVRLDPETGRPLERAWSRTNIDGAEYFTAEIRYPKSKEHLLASWNEWRDRAGRFGFHYTPYNFDSGPELDFFDQVLGLLEQDPDDIEDVYFTGGITDPAKTEFFVEYRDVDGHWRRYTPDFVIRRKDGRVLIVEIKDARFEAATRDDLERHRRGEPPITTEGRKAIALKQWERLDPERIRYEIVFAAENIPFGRMAPVREFVATGQVSRASEAS